MQAGGGEGRGAGGRRGPDSGVSAALCCSLQAGAVGAGGVTPPCCRRGCPCWAASALAPTNAAVLQVLSRPGSERGAVKAEVASSAPRPGQTRSSGEDRFPNRDLESSAVRATRASEHGTGSLRSLEPQY